jgi:putative thioredoxin
MYIDVTDATFGTEVMERSKQVPVVVDLWAEWCGPCRTLGPIIEKVVGETNGKVVLAKVDVDSNPQVAQAFQVQGIPAVYALRDGKVVTGFQGAQPEEVVRQFVESLLPSDDEARIEALVDAGDEASLRQALEVDPGHERAVTALAELLVRRRDDGDVEEALALLGRIPDTPEARHVAALARAGDGAAAPDDLAGELDALLDRVKDDDESRQRYLDLLELMGPADPRTAEYRKQLTSRLF